MPKLPYITDLEFVLNEDPITIGDGKFTIHNMPWDGRILSNRNGPLIRGWIQTAGTGAGTATQIQIRNATKGRDYFATEPEFAVDDADANGHASLSSGILGTFQGFNAGDDLVLDCDGVPTGGDSAKGIVWLTVEMYREQS